MLDWLKKRFSKPEWDLGSVAPPWGERQAIAAFIEAGLDEAGVRLPDSGVALPDEARVASEAGVRFAAGARDGIAIYHLASVEEPEVAAELVGLVRAVLADGGLVHLPALYGALVAHRALTWIDELGPAIALEPQPDPNRLYALGLWLCTQAPDREAVKAGIAMLALLDLAEDDLALLRLLGSHDELTLYAAVALAAQSDEPDLELWSLARRVTGWGRVHVVQRLADTGDPAIRSWLLREGFRNGVMDRYLALICAEAGDLATALAEEDDDPALLAGATDLLAALLEPDGPTAGMEAWEDGALATERWLDLVAGLETPPLAALPVLARIAELGVGQDPPWPPDAAQGLADRAAALRSAPGWRDRVLAGLAADGATFDQALAAANVLGLDTFDAWLRRLSPTSARAWQGALAAAGSPARVGLVLDRARDLLPAELAAGEDGSGAAPRTVAGQVLSAVLHAARRSPGLAAPLVLAGLDSALPQHRNLALRALIAWPQMAWPDGAHERVARLHQEDPEASVRENAAAAWGAPVEA